MRIPQEMFILQQLDFNNAKQRAKLYFRTLFLQFVRVQKYICTSVKY